MWLIAQRELQTRGRSKGFLVSTGVLFLCVALAAVVPSLLGNSERIRTVHIGLSGSGQDFEQAIGVGNETLEPKVVRVKGGLAELEAEQLDVVFDGRQLTWKALPDFTLDEYLRGVIQQKIVADRAAALDLSSTELEAIFQKPNIQEVRLDGGDDEFGLRFATAGVSGLATFLLIQIWGAFVMMGVVEEKSSKVVEVLLSHVRPSTLLSGKVLGLGLLAVAQMAIVIAGVAAGLAASSGIDVPAGVWSTIPLLAVTFLLGFGFYATAFAAVGAMVSRQEDAQSAQLPVLFPLMLGYFIASFNIGSPDSPLVVLGSFLPFTSPVLLPFRTAMTDVPLWEILVSLGILGASSVVMLRVAARIYRYSLLRSGVRVTWREWWRNRNEASL
ncbi:MAG TPA: hypothetical protein DEG43_15155 [Acidimicrobiaceae bacterium]|jgi:ABC-2 type transport system permease protein|nr:hypothetical protein [Acidimicrobiaceae bacterium]